jgi:outer membrane protein assembly factor BamB
LNATGDNLWTVLDGRNGVVLLAGQRPTIGRPAYTFGRVRGLIIVGTGGLLLFAVPGEVALRWSRTHTAPIEVAPVWIPRERGPLIALAERDSIYLHNAESGGEDKRVAATECPLTTAAADVDGDGRTDLLAGCDDGTVLCIDVDKAEVRWRFKTAMRVRTVPVAGDSDGDGRPEIIAGSDDGHVYALDGRDGTLKWRFRTGGPVRGSPAIGDVDGDGRTDVVVGSNDDRVYVLDGATGRATWWFECADDAASGLRLADLDGDRVPEIVAGSADGHVYILKVVSRQ